ncbi:hypothetical protein CPT_Melville_203 [Salmonella phage Melville]|uniref:Uncharacterized protein n=1 Tax=Salmonella phage Melville TaxID=2041413 RepID=A0A2D1GM84_9CAUD|nr:hypothetical protein FDI73_gp198 [Salmonella phage Melville]ATN93166.1 hypothetical protein CPT_Melville_203 [Salmonella phage Melville]UPW42311.1 hypothetical protein EBPHNEJP_00013 [Salmonella phage CF-SP2]
MKTKYKELQTVQLKSSGIPGTICHVIKPIAKYGVLAAYEIDWVDGNRSVHMEQELSPITMLREIV